MTSVVDLHRALVRIPSVSGEEHACRDALLAWLESNDFRAWTSGRNVLGVREGGRPAPDDRGLLFLTHIDVVPVGPGWTRDPWGAELEAGFIYGRGSNDAKASVAAMAVACAGLDVRQLAGRVIVAFVCDEETGGEGIEVCGSELPGFDAAVVGEPTELDACPGQRGLFRARIHLEGVSSHASRPWEGNNAIRLAVPALQALAAIDLGEADPLLGPATLEPTVIQGGTRANVLPGACVIDLDGRPTPTFDNAAMEGALKAALSGVPGCRVEIKSNRFTPVRTDPSERIVTLASQASPTGRVRAFGGLSDFFHVRHVPGVVMGPGTSAASHAADESVAVSQLEAAVSSYAQLAQAYLGGAHHD